VSAWVFKRPMEYVLTINIAPKANVLTFHQMLHPQNIVVKEEGLRTFMVSECVEIHCPMGRIAPRQQIVQVAHASIINAQNATHVLFVGDEFWRVEGGGQARVPC